MTTSPQYVGTPGASPKKEPKPPQARPTRPGVTRPPKHSTRRTSAGPSGPAAWPTPDEDEVEKATGRVDRLVVLPREVVNGVGGGEGLLGRMWLTTLTSETRRAFMTHANAPLTPEGRRSLASLGDRRGKADAQDRRAVRMLAGNSQAVGRPVSGGRVADRPDFPSASLPLSAASTRRTADHRFAFHPPPGPASHRLPLASGALCGRAGPGTLPHAPFWRTRIAPPGCQCASPGRCATRRPLRAI